MASIVTLPPFAAHSEPISRLEDVFELLSRNPHPTDVVVDSSAFSMDRLPFARTLFLHFSPILLPPVEEELQDLKAKPDLLALRDFVFPDGVVHSGFRRSRFSAFEAYPRVAWRYTNLLRWRKLAIDIPLRKATRLAGTAPKGKDRSKLIHSILRMGVAHETITLANKDHRADRIADEVLAVFGVLNPIVTGRDCFVLTADRDVFEQAIRMCDLVFDDYGAFLLARDFRNDDARYGHRHEAHSFLFEGKAVAIGRAAEPDYLLPPPMLTKTCSTTVIDLKRLKTFTWISARNIEAAISFQEGDPLGRKGDPDGEHDILFNEPVDPADGSRCKSGHHFVIGHPTLLKVVEDTEAPFKIGPVPLFDLARAFNSNIRMAPGRTPRVLSPFAAHRERLTRALPRRSSGG
jgi:hypothetical protein